MLKIKKISVGIIATLATATMFSACSKEVGSFEEFKVANTNMANVESANFVGNLSIGTQADAESEIASMQNIIISASFMEKGKKMSQEMSSAMMPEMPPQKTYTSDGFTYVPFEADTYLKISTEQAAGMNPAKLQELNNTINTQLMDMLETVEMSTAKYTPLDGEDPSVKGVEYSYEVPKEVYKDILSTIVKELFDNDEYREQYLAQTKSQLLSMGMPQEDIDKEETLAELNATIESTIEMYKTIFNNIEFDKLFIKQVIDGENVVKVDAEIKLSQESLSKIMGPETESFAAMLPMMFGDNEYLVANVGITYTNINAVTEIEMPEFTAENSFTQEELMAKMMEELGGLENPVEGEVPVEGETPATPEGEAPAPTETPAPAAA